MYVTPYGNFYGNTWEDFCQQCFKKKYESDGYQEMPADFKGDLGIEGFTRNGILLQCYCPDAAYDPTKLYEAQRDKITTDLGKLQANQKELLEYLKDIKVEKWIFVTPGYRNKELVRHCQNKAEEYRKLKLPHLSDTFDVLIHDVEFFSAEIPTILNFRQDKLNLSPKEQLSPEEIADWRTKSITLVDNAIRKHGARLATNSKNYNDRVNKLTQLSITNFLDGDGVIRQWSEKYQDQYEKFVDVVGLFEKKVEEKCTAFSGDFNSLYEQIETELRAKLKESFSYLDSVMIDRLTYRVMADWILRCPIDFE